MAAQFRRIGWRRPSFRPPLQTSGKFSALTSPRRKDAHMWSTRILGKGLDGKKISGKEVSVVLASTPVRSPQPGQMRVHVAPSRVVWPSPVLVQCKVPSNQLESQGETPVLVPLDAGAMRQRNLRPKSVIEHKQLSCSDFKCGRRVKLDTRPSKQSAQMQLQPKAWKDGGASVIVCLVSLNPELGKSVWRLLGHAEVALCKVSPAELQLLEDVGRELKRWAVHLHHGSCGAPQAPHDAKEAVGMIQQVKAEISDEMLKLRVGLSEGARITLQEMEQTWALEPEPRIQNCRDVSCMLDGFPTLEFCAEEDATPVQGAWSMVSMKVCDLFLQLQKIYADALIKVSPSEAEVLEFLAPVRAELDAWAASLALVQHDPTCTAQKVVRASWREIVTQMQELLPGRMTNAAKVLLEGYPKRPAGHVARTLSGFPSLELPSCFRVPGEPQTLNQKMKRMVSQELCALFLQLQQTYNPGCVIQAYPVEEAVLEFASRVGQELTAWADYLQKASDLPASDVDVAAAVDLVVGVQQRIWADIQSLTQTGSFSNAAKVLLEGCPKRAIGPVALTLSGFPPLEMPSCFMVPGEPQTLSQKVQRTVSQELIDLLLQLQEMYKGCLVRPTEEEASLLDYAAQIVRELSGCSRLPSDVHGVDFVKVSADMASGARRQIWREIVKRDSTNAAKVLFNRQELHSESESEPPVVYHKGTSVGGFPVFLFPFETEKPSKGALQQVRLAASQHVQSEFGALARKSDLKCIQAATHESVVAHTLRSDLTESCRMEVDQDDHGLAPMDDILVGDGFDGWNRVKGLGPVLTVYALKEPGQERLQLRHLACGPVVLAEKATSGMTYNFIRNVEFFDEDAEEENLAAFFRSVKVKLPADPLERKEALLKLYTSEAVYRKLNQAMYQDDAEGLRRFAPYIRALRGVFKRGQNNLLPGFNFFIGSKNHLRRGCNLTKEHAEVYQINQKVCWPAFTSTSEADKGGQFGCLQFHVRCRDSMEDPNESEGYFPASIAPWSHYKTEVLMPPHFMLRVHNINYNDSPDDTKQWVIELELADLVPVWDIIAQRNWQQFNAWAQANPDLLDTSKSRRSIINAVASSLAAEQENETGVDPLEVCFHHGARPNEIDMQTGNTPLTTIALQCVESGKTEQALAVIDSLLLAGANPYIKAGPHHQKSLEQLMPGVDLRLSNYAMGWQYWFDDGWYPWSEDGSAKLEHAFQVWLDGGHAGRSKLLAVRSEHFSYDVDFLNMKQANSSTGTRRKIRRYRQRRRSVLLSHDQLLADSEAKLRQELMTLLQKLLMRAAVDAVQQAACRLQDAIAAGMLSGLSQMLDAEAPASAAEIAAASSELEKLVLGDFDDKAKEAEEAKVSLRNLREACDLNWDTREKVREVVRHLQDDPHVKLADDLIEGAEAFATSNTVFQRKGITHAGFRASLSWESGDKPTDLDMYMVCPKCNVEVYFSKKECGCNTDELCRLNLDVDNLGSCESRSEENLYMQLPHPGRYKLQVELFSGPAVPFRVQVHRSGQALRVYRVAPHTEEKQDGRIVIFEASADAEGIMRLESGLQHLDVMLSAD
ncbi:unnamed protein product [Effrenium voratum]|uniref:WWE domain-containing protein n=1 Tax=Effrenium voratum TaxID=2562239 RepID=A0AA36HP57_9DINO|nr:unnamed protein product [Effrenium voratum]